MTHDAAALAALLDYVRTDRRVCPNPIPWNQLWEMLRRNRQVADERQPAAPLILSAWHFSDDGMKRARLREQVEWAAEHGAFVATDAFLRGLPSTDWHYEED
jgi:hypothetical protein